MQSLDVQGGDYLPLVKSIARKQDPRAYARRHANPDDYADLIMAGAAGVLRAERNYDPARGVPFGEFARKYVIGAVADEVRRLKGRAVAIPERQAGNKELYRVNAETVRLSDPFYERQPDDTIRTEGTQGDRLHSRLPGPNLDRRVEREFLAGMRRLEALGSLWELDGSKYEDERNIRIVISARQDFVVAMALDRMMPERAALPPLLTGERLQYFRFQTDQDAEQIGGVGAALVVRVAGEYPEGYVKEELRKFARTPEEPKVVAAAPGVGVWFPYPTTVAGIARHLKTTRRQIYKVLNAYEKVLATVRAERRVNPLKVEPHVQDD